MSIAVYIYLFSIALALAIGLWNYRNLSPLVRTSLLYLFVSLVVEITGAITAHLRVRNYWLYDLFIPFEFLFFAFLFVQSFKRHQLRNFGRIYTVLFSLFALANICFIQGLRYFDSYTFLIGSFFTVVLSSFYLYQLFVYDSGESLKTKPLFWISIGLIFFYLTNLIHLGLYNYLVSTHRHAAETLRKFLQVNDSIMYSFYSVAFICSKKTQK